ncbi:hypothetical protein [Paenibacillus sp. SSG-1]|uniref:hypothetical protein n=1 Tax=Paenibacillus sp. SSG-1 TaxID=1443669 RepID=UPI0015C5B417|nr:hypothetical protein [Paenibacillus sp. SSG-1]
MNKVTIYCKSGHVVEVKTNADLKDVAGCHLIAGAVPEIRVMDFDDVSLIIVEEA